jgi:hypothetical protein
MYTYLGLENHRATVGFEVLMVVGTKMAVFSVVAAGCVVVRPVVGGSQVRRKVG